MPSASRPFTLSIAGHDPSGGAGTLADIKTFEQIGTQGLAILTANTLQTESQFFHTRWQPLDEIVTQIDTLASYYPIAATKIGIVPSYDYLATIVQHLRALHPAAPLVIDPVLQATAASEPFVTHSATPLTTLLAPGVLLTPNLDEYAALFPGTPPETVVASTGCGILIKGGHNPTASGQVTDTLYTPAGTYDYTVARSPYSKHGTGCILSSAIAAYLALGQTLTDACQCAQAYVARYINSSPTRLGIHRP